MEIYHIIILSLIIYIYININNLQKNQIVQNIFTLINKNNMGVIILCFIISGLILKIPIKDALIFTFFVLVILNFNYNNIFNMMNIHSPNIKKINKDKNNENVNTVLNKNTKDIYNLMNTNKNSNNYLFSNMDNNTNINTSNINDYYNTPIQELNKKYYGNNLCK